MVLIFKLSWIRLNIETFFFLILGLYSSSTVHFLDINSITFNFFSLRAKFSIFLYQASRYSRRNEFEFIDTKFVSFGPSSGSV